MFTLVWCCLSLRYSFFVWRSLRLRHRGSQSPDWRKAFSILYQSMFGVVSDYVITVANLRIGAKLFYVVQDVPKGILNCK
jgi:hypothetical protein